LTKSHQTIKICVCSATDPERSVVIYETASQTVFSITLYRYFCVTNIQIITEVLG